MGEREIPIEVIGTIDDDGDDTTENLRDLADALNRQANSGKPPLQKSSSRGSNRNSYTIPESNSGSSSKRASLIITHDDGTTEEDTATVTTLRLSQENIPNNKVLIEEYSSPTASSDEGGDDIIPSAPVKVEIHNVPERVTSNNQSGTNIKIIRSNEHLSERLSICELDESEPETETGTELIKDTKEKSQAPTPPPTPTVTPEREGETPGVAGDSRLMGSPTFKEVSVETPTTLSTTISIQISKNPLTGGKKSTIHLPSKGVWDEVQDCAISANATKEDEVPASQVKDAERKAVAPHHQLDQHQSRQDQPPIRKQQEIRETKLDKICETKIGKIRESEEQEESQPKPLLQRRISVETQTPIITTSSRQHASTETDPVPNLTVLPANPYLQETASTVSVLKDPQISSCQQRNTTYILPENSSSGLSHIKANITPEESSNALSANIHKYITNKSITDTEFITCENDDERTNSINLREKSQTDENRGTTGPIGRRSVENRVLPTLETLRTGDGRDEHDYIELGTRSDRATSEDINSLLSRDGEDYEELTASIGDSTWSPQPTDQTWTPIPDCQNDLLDDSFEIIPPVTSSPLPSATFVQEKSETSNPQPSRDDEKEVKVVRIPIQIQAEDFSKLISNKNASGPQMDEMSKNIVETSKTINETSRSVNESSKSIVETCKVESSQTLVNKQGTPTMERKIVNLVRTTSTENPKREDDIMDLNKTGLKAEKPNTSRPVIEQDLTNRENKITEHKGEPSKVPVRIIPIHVEGLQTPEIKRGPANSMKENGAVGARARLTDKTPDRTELHQERIQERERKETVASKEDKAKKEPSKSPDRKHGAIPKYKESSQNTQQQATASNKVGAVDNIRPIPIQLENGDLIKPTFNTLEELAPPAWSVFHNKGDEKERVVPIKIETQSTQDQPPPTSQPDQLRLNSRTSPAPYQSQTFEPQTRPSSDPRSLNTPGSLHQPPRSAPSQPYSRSSSGDPRSAPSQSYSRSNSGDPRSAPSQSYSRSNSGDPRSAPSQSYSRSNSGDPRNVPSPSFTRSKSGDSRTPEPRAGVTPEPRTSRTSFTRGSKSPDMTSTRHESFTRSDSSPSYVSEVYEKTEREEVFEESSTKILRDPGSGAGIDLENPFRDSSKIFDKVERQSRSVEREVRNTEQSRKPDLPVDVGATVPNVSKSYSSERSSSTTQYSSLSAQQKAPGKPVEPLVEVNKPPVGPVRTIPIRKLPENPPQDSESTLPSSWTPRHRTSQNYSGAGRVGTPTPGPQPEDTARREALDSLQKVHEELEAARHRLTSQVEQLASNLPNSNIPRMSRSSQNPAYERSRSVENDGKTARSGDRNKYTYRRERSLQDIDKDIETIWKELQELDSLPVDDSTEPSESRGGDRPPSAPPSLSHQNLVTPPWRIRSVSGNQTSEATSYRSKPNNRDLPAYKPTTIWDPPAASTDTPPSRYTASPPVTLSSSWDSSKPNYFPTNSNHFSFLPKAETKPGFITPTYISSSPRAGRSFARNVPIIQNNTGTKAEATAKKLKQDFLKSDKAQESRARQVPISQAQKTDHSQDISVIGRETQNRRFSHTGGYERKLGGPGLSDAAGTGVPTSSIRDSRSKSTDRSMLGGSGVPGLKSCLKPDSKSSPTPPTAKRNGEQRQGVNFKSQPTAAPAAATAAPTTTDVGSGPDLIYDWVDFSSKGGVGPRGKITEKVDVPIQTSSLPVGKIGVERDQKSGQDRIDVPIQTSNKSSLAGIKELPINKGLNPFECGDCLEKRDAATGPCAACDAGTQTEKKKNCRVM